MRKTAILISIVILAFFLRFYQLDNNPPSLNWDEVSNGYNAYSILKTGKDEWGVKFPLIFRAYGDFKLPLYIYLTAISEFFFGLNAFSVRLVSVLSGTGLVILAYLITLKITKDKTTSLMASFITALSPWGLFVSRIAVEANLGAFLFALGGYFIIRWIFDYRKKDIFLSFLFWGLSLYAYNSCRVVVPISMIFIFAFAVKNKKIKQLFAPGIIMILFLIPLVFQLVDKSGSARFNLVSLIDQGTINTINEARSNSKFPLIFSKVIFSKPSYFLYYSFKNYVSNLSPVYLFFKGGSHYQFSQPLHELLFLVTVPFLVIGMIKSFLMGKLSRTLLIWFFISIIPSAITRDAPHVLRTLLILPVPMILSAVGFKVVFDFLKTRSSFRSYPLTIIFVFAILFSFYRWWSDYTSTYKNYYSWAWQYSYKPAAAFIKENYSKYDRFIITKRYGEPHEFVLFYLGWDPKKYQNDDGKKWDYHADWYWVDGFDKFTFVNDWEVIGGAKCEAPASTQRGEGSEKCLLITSPGNYSKGWTKIKTIEFLDGEPAFDILDK